jgi:predicted XRE-type DNA-binding protein
VAKFAEAIFVLRCFEKKSQRTSRLDIDLAARRYRELVKELMALREHIASEGLSQAAAAKLLGVTQPRVSDLVRGKIDLFSLDTLVNMAAAAGLRIQLQVDKAA